MTGWAMGLCFIVSIPLFGTCWWLISLAANGACQRAVEGAWGAGGLACGFILIGVLLGANAIQDVGYRVQGLSLTVDEYRVLSSCAETVGCDAEAVLKTLIEYRENQIPDD